MIAFFASPWPFLHATLLQFDGETWFSWYAMSSSRSWSLYSKSFIMCWALETLCALSWLFGAELIPESIEIIHDLNGEPMLAMLVKKLARVTVVSLSDNKMLFKVILAPGSIVSHTCSPYAHNAGALRFSPEISLHCLEAIAWVARLCISERWKHIQFRIATCSPRIKHIKEGCWLIKD